MKVDIADRPPLEVRDATGARRELRQQLVERFWVGQRIVSVKPTLRCADHLAWFVLDAVEAITPAYA